MARTSKGRLALASWSFVLDHLEGRLEEAGEDRGAHEVWQLRCLCQRLEEPIGTGDEELRSIVDEAAGRLIERGIFETKGFGVGRGPGFYRRFGALVGRMVCSIGYNEQHARRFEESLLWLRGHRRSAEDFGPSVAGAGHSFRSYELDGRLLFPLDIPEQAAREVVVQCLIDQVEGIAELLSKQDVETSADALGTLTRAWPTFVTECRSVLGSELHYQALLYHCLRTHGGVPSGQLGMNVKIWIEPVTTEYFRNLDKQHAEGYGGGYEPIPDVVIFRRRNNKNTLRQMLVAVEVKASERHLGRLTAREIVDDIKKLNALRTEVSNKEEGSDPLPAVVVVDTAPEPKERMTPEAREVVEAAAREHRVCFFYASPSEESVVPPSVP